jgi:hypothetical protein
MSLPIAREIVLHRMAEADGPLYTKNLNAAIWQWWNLYKAWEEGDTFKTAFEQSRLCITQRPVGTKQYDMKAKQGGSTLTEFPGVKYSVGTDSIKARLNPDNFRGTAKTGMEMKYALGLFDLSGSLLNPAYDTIKGQLRWGTDSSKGGMAVVFVALPHEEDVALYNLIKIHVVRKRPEPELEDMIRFFSDRMTRPSLADPGDMGAGPSDLSAEGEPTYIRYGWKTATRGVLTNKTKERAKTAAYHYKSILDNARAVTGRGSQKVVSSNEVTITLRQSKSNRFPIITEYSAEHDAFVLEGSVRHFPHGGIPDRWRQVREVT